VQEVQIKRQGEEKGPKKLVWKKLVSFIRIALFEHHFKNNFYSI
jgi:hypothetical protein